MEYKILEIKHNKLIRDFKELDEKIKNNEKFAKILNNLLAIKTRGDSAIFTNINKTNIDLFSIFNEGDINQIFTNPNFKVKIKRDSIDRIKKLINNIKTKKELIELKDDLNISTYKINNFKFKDDIILQEQDQWDLFKRQIIELNKEKISTFNSRWTRFNKSVQDIYEQNNIWPLYIGTFFIKANINNKALYAPLIFKEVEIIEESNEMYIQSKNDSLLINEKLTFFLEEYRSINMPKISEQIDEATFENCVKELTHYFNKIIKFNNFNIIEKIKKLKTIEVTNLEIIREAGIALMVCNPIGSALRTAVIELMNSGKLNGNLIKSNFSGIDIEEEKFINNIINEREAIPRVCKTDFSQEKAIMSSLDDSTIIIGPPGTGKSQTISNILANIFFKNKTALFISQKKVALEVVLDRLQELRFFSLQLIENANRKNSNEKQNFYYNLQNFLKLISRGLGLYGSNGTTKDCFFSPLVTKELKEYWDSKKTEIENIDIEIFANLKENISLLDDYLIDTFSEYKNEYSILTEESIEIFKLLKNSLSNKFSKEFIEKIKSNNDGLNNLKWDEVVSFINFLNLYNNINKDKLDFFFRHKENFNQLDWDSIEKFREMYNLVNINKKKDILSILKNINEIFIKFNLIKKIEYIDQIYLLSHTNNKETFAKEFKIDKKRILFFKIWDKNFKEFWNIKETFKNNIEKYNISRLLVNYLIGHWKYFDTWITNTSFIQFLVENDISKDVYTNLKCNLNNLNSWLKYFDFLKIINSYSLDENLIYTLKENQKLFDFWIFKFDFFELIYKYDITFENVKIINKITNAKNLKEIYYIYKEHHSNLIPNSNNYKSDKNTIFKSLVINVLREIENFDLETKEKFRKLKGRIERAFTKPYSLVSLFKEIFKKLFKVVVSTPESLATYVDFLNEEYDYIIFDEASQMFLEKAIPFLAIGKKIIIAGDDQQMQPTNWFGLRVDDEEQEQEEENIDSLLTYAINSGIKKQILELNYRSDHANLTSFSSKHFYDSKLKCLDNKNAQNNTSNSIEIVNVNGEWIDKTNEVEAYKMIELLKENINKYEKIILLTFNASQMDLVDFILSKDEPEIYKRISIDRTIILKNLENIQGDEADLVIVSIAYTKDTKLSGTYICREGGKNALNVAITRAKKKMIILKSIDSSEINPTNENIQLFKYWLSFIEATKEEQKNYSIPKESIFDSIVNVESNFEKEVLEWLAKQEFSRDVYATSQFSVGSYRIDIALIDSKTNQFLIGIEVDGYKYHSSPRQKYNDEIRQNFIEDKGYKLMRIPELLWKTNKSKILEEINEYISIY